MKKIIYIAAFFILTLASDSFAGSLGKPVFEMKSEISSICYEEPDIMEEKGLMCGTEASLGFYNKYMIELNGRFSSGQVGYSSPISGIVDNIDDYILEFRGLGGYSFPISKTDIIITPYTGLGYRYLNDDLRGITSSGAIGYERESCYLYSPIGVRLSAKPGARLASDFKKGWYTGASIEYDLFWEGQQNSHLSDASAAFNDLENRQKKGYGIRSSVEIGKKFKEVDLFLEPFLRYWNVKRSNGASIVYSGLVVGYGYEPPNRSTEYGLGIGVRF